MLRGDISNEVYNSIAFRADDCLFKKRGKKYSTDREILAAMNFAFYNTENTVDVVCKLYNPNEEEQSAELEEILCANDVPYSRIFLVKNDKEVWDLLYRGVISYYVDCDEWRMGVIGSEHCLNLSQFYWMFRGRRV